MDKILTDIDLCEALSDIFVDTETNYSYIASTVKHFSIECVEMVYFEWVAPICYGNACSSIPPIWMGFDREELWKDIQKYKEKNSQLGFFAKFFHKCFFCYLRNEYITKSGWIELKKHLKVLKK